MSMEWWQNIKSGFIKAIPALKEKHPNAAKSVRITKTRVENAAAPVSNKIESAAKAYNRKHILQTDFKKAAKNPTANKKIWVSDKVKPAIEKKAEAPGLSNNAAPGAKPTKSGRGR